ncbi:MAG: SRPBCC family protein [Myxococcales bacterium]|nr:SRPBCC family protein [Myxococcales bacterium]
MIGSGRVTVLGLVLAAGTLGAALAGYASILPPERTTSAWTELDAPHDAVFALIGDPERLGEWHPAATGLEVASTDAPWRVRTHGTDDADTSLTWTWTLEERPDSEPPVTRVSVVVDGVTHDWVQRLIQSFAPRNADAIQLQLTALRDHFQPSGDPP